MFKEGKKKERKGNGNIERYRDFTHAAFEMYLGQ
jgi:hypothetical protein